METTYEDAPEWLTKEYIETVLRKYKQDDGLTISKLSLSPATAKGENYSSVMTRIGVSFCTSDRQEPQQASYILKTPYTNDAFAAQMMLEYDVYNTEMLLYDKVLPELSKMLQQIGDDDKLFADTVHVDYERTAIIFEDLRVYDFVLGDRLAGFDEPHAKLTLKKLAKMHATAAVFNERQADFLKRFQRGIINRHFSGLSVFFEKMLRVAGDFAGECPELGAYYKQKLHKLAARAIEYTLRTVDEHEGHFHTLAHGDFWVNNVMLRYAANALAVAGIRHIADILIIDFQYCSWTTPALDLHYFLNTSLDLEMRGRTDELVQHYHGVLADTLAKLHYAGHIPTLHDLCLQLEAGGFYAVMATLVAQAVILNEQTDDADFCNFIGETARADNFRRTLYSNKVLHDHLKKRLPELDRRGLLDLQD